MASPRTLHWEYLGRVPYGEALALQLAARAALKSGEGPERFFLLEHPHVYTLGRNASGADVLAGPEWLAARGIEVVECDRGGQVTYHGPGQLVGYPIVNLSPDRRDVRRYVRDLQEVLIRTLSGFGIAAQPGEGQENIGVWVGEEKIASIGVHLSRWITTHGFALNVSTDLSYFAGIIPCGLHQVRMTSIERLTGQAPSLPEVAVSVASHFGEIFSRELVEEIPTVAALPLSHA
ncbi:MAG TPA: lipoyl(octanoyl) transferase LipB [Thermoanaerobaculia bacterium]|nr:lipoyl(octanoyl) transferase LipB [Thermoanaerobaculia bacterium]